MTGNEITELDRRLREACAQEQVETAGVKSAIRAAIGHRSPWRWARRLAMAATVIAAVAWSGYLAVRRTPEPKIFVDAALDHRAEVVRKAPRHWRTTDADIDTLTARFGIGRQRIAFSGYRLMRAKICLLDGRRVLHLVYEDGAEEYSLYLSTGGASVPLTETQDGAEHIAGFHANRIDGLVVGDGAARDCSRFVQAVTAAL